MIRILLTTASFQDVPGEHHTRLEAENFDITRARGPLSEKEMLDLAGDFDAFLCGDDEITEAVLEKSKPRLKVISKYGIGVDKINIAKATEMGIPVTFCPGVNHTTVAEHCILLMLALSKHLVAEAGYTQSGQWKRLTGNEIMGKNLGVFGIGRIGKEVCKRAQAFGMNLLAHDLYWDENFASQYGVRQVSLEDLLQKSDILSLHTNLSDSTRHVINSQSLAQMKSSALIINCARGELVHSADMAQALKAGTIAGYGTDVLDQEPPPAHHPLLKAPNCIVTPHIGSRTHESVNRQAAMAVSNLIAALKGEPPLAQVNNVPVQKVY